MLDRERLSMIFKALASSIRLDIIAELADDARMAGGEGAGLGITELGRRVEITRFAASFHLDQLREAGLVEKRRHGTRWVHTLSVDAVDLVDDWLCELMPRQELVGVA